MIEELVSLNNILTDKDRQIQLAITCARDIEKELSEKLSKANKTISSLERQLVLMAKLLASSTMLNADAQEAQPSFWLHTVRSEVEAMDRKEQFIKNLEERDKSIGYKCNLCGNIWGSKYMANKCCMDE